jgi:hypothetical protein
MDCRIKSIKSTNDEDGASFRDKRVDCLVREIRDGHSSSQTVPGFHRACHRAGHFGPDPLVQSGYVCARTILPMSLLDWFEL